MSRGRRGDTRPPLQKFQLITYDRQRQPIDHGVTESRARVRGGFLNAYHWRFPGYPPGWIYAEEDGEGGAHIFENSGRRVASFKLLGETPCEK